MSIDREELRKWIGRSETRDDHVTMTPLAALAATLDRDDPAPQPGSAIPPLWHWLYFTPLARQGEIGPDGHAERGGFLPPVALPRRMWAGSRLTFHHPLRVGEAIERRSVIASVEAKEGRSGPLVFVTVHHRIAGALGEAITEEQDIVYRGHPGVAAAPAARAHDAGDEGDFSQRIVPDPVLLFRYSALTFNGHRIHYDRSYVTGVEGYPGLVVHGPLIATLLVELLRRERPDAELRSFTFRALSPLFDTAEFRVCGRSSTASEHALWALGPDGAMAMQATATTR